MYWILQYRLVLVYISPVHGVLFAVLFKRTSKRTLSYEYTKIEPSLNPVLSLSHKAKLIV